MGPAGFLFSVFLLCMLPVSELATTTRTAALTGNVCGAKRILCNGNTHCCKSLGESGHHRCAELRKKGQRCGGKTYCHCVIGVICKKDETRKWWKAGDGKCVEDNVAYHGPPPVLNLDAGHGSSGSKKTGDVTTSEKPWDATSKKPEDASKRPDHTTTTKEISRTTAKSDNPPSKISDDAVIPRTSGEPIIQKPGKPCDKKNEQVSIVLTPKPSGKQ